MGRVDGFLVALGAVGGAVRWHTLGDRSLWMDEIRQVGYSSLDSAAEVVRMATTQNQPPLDYLIGWLMLSVFDFSEQAVRFPALVFGVLTLFALFYLARSIFSTSVGVVSASIACVSPTLVQYSQEARPYSIFFFLFLAVLVLFFRAARENRWRDWAVFGAVLFLMLLSRALMPLLVVATLDLAVAVMALSNRMHGRFPWTVAVRCWLASIVALAAYAPVLFMVLAQSAQYVPEPFSMSAGSLAHSIGSLPVVRMVGDLAAFTRPAHWALGLFFAIGAVVVGAGWRRNPGAACLLLVALGLPVVHLLVQVEKGLPPATRYYVYYLPLLFLMAAVGIVQAGAWGARLAGGRAWVAVLVPVALTVPIAGVSWGRTLDYYRTNTKTDWGRASAYLERHIDAETAILAESHASLGHWNPGFYGRRFYFSAPNPDYDVFGLAREATRTPQVKGDVALLFMHYPPNAGLEVDESRFDVQRFFRLSVIRLREPSPYRLANFSAILDEMIRVAPARAGGVRYRIAKAQLLVGLGKVGPAYRQLLTAERLATDKERAGVTKLVAVFRGQYGLAGDDADKEPDRGTAATGPQRMRTEK